jgi:DNA-binding CsgD family transcriptional regulator
MGWRDLPAPVGGLGAGDKLTLNAVEPDGSGYLFGSFLADVLSPSRRIQAALGRVGAHLSCAHRLRRRFAGASVSPHAADAVLEPSGRLLDATRSVGAVECAELRRASRARDRARTRRARQDALGAIAQWPAVVGQRWTLVDMFDHDGRRFVLAVDNRPKAETELLSRRERDVVRWALAGKSNKVIAYEMGVAHSTVRVLMARAAAKMGATSRSDLLTKMR